MDVGQLRRGIEQIVGRGERVVEARHGAALRLIAHAGALRHVRRALAPPALGGELRLPCADLAQLAVVRRHRRDGRALRAAELQLEHVQVTVDERAELFGRQRVGQRRQRRGLSGHAHA